MGFCSGSFGQIQGLLILRLKIGQQRPALEGLQQLHMCRHIDIFQGVQLHHRFKPGNIIGPLFARKDIGAYLNRCG
jgi:hypothetical protein